MTESDKRKPAGATIQIDLTDVQLVDPDAAMRGPESNRAPPPLPASALVPPAAPATASPARTGPTSRQLAVLIAGVVIAIAAGLAVGLGARGGAAPAASASTPRSPSSPPVALRPPSPAPSASVLTIPPIEVK